MDALTASFVGTVEVRTMSPSETLGPKRWLYLLPPRHL